MSRSWNRIARQLGGRHGIGVVLILLVATAQAGPLWVDQRRDVSADFLKAFGYAPLTLTGLAIASDMDNTGEEAHAGFADFHFVAVSESCVSGN